ncbi:unnamed protein product [Orchesella dallaii]|uniref:Gustatory receptor n=1 Tax=Orchesella dallaii TaxID=48710 RepID=A0ABP1R6K6_9HEXA
MLLKHEFIPIILEGLKIDSLFHITPFQWDAQASRFRIKNTLSSRFWRVAGCIYFYITGSVILLSVLGNNEKLDLPQRSQKLVMGLALICCGTIFWTLHTKHRGMVAVLNGLIKLEQQMDRDAVMNPHDFRTILVKLIAKVLVLTGKSYAVLGALGAACDPKFPTNSFAIYTPDLENLDDRYWSIVFRLLSTFVNFVVWHFLGLLGVISCLTMIVPMEAIRVFQLSLQNYTNNSLSFEKWLNTKDLYDRLRLLIQIFNQVYANGVAVHLLILMSVAQVSSVYCLIRCVGLPAPILFTLLFIVVDTYVVIVGVYGCAGEVNKASKLVTAELRRISRNANGILARKMTSGFPDLRIGFGSANFIEQTTPLEFLNFNNCRIVDMILFKR